MRWVGLVGLLLLADCSAPKEPSTEAKPSALVHTAIVGATDLPERLTVYGAAEVTPAAERVIAAPLESIVEQVLVAVGERVTPGEALVRIMPTPAMQLQIAAAAREAQASQIAYARALRLRATGLVSDADVETARAATATAQTLAQSFSARAGAVLHAPGRGLVDTIGAAPGDLVAAGVAILKIGPGDGSRVRLGVASADVAKLRAGQRVRLTPTEGGPTVVGAISSVDPRTDAQTRLASAFVTLPAGLQIGAGQPLQGDIVVGDRKNVASVPREALLYEGDTPYLFVVGGGVAHRRDVVLGVDAGDRVEIRKGVLVGDRVAVDGGTALQDGMAVREEAGPAPSRP